MADNTPNLNLYKGTTGSTTETFNIKTMLNDNWEKIDKADGQNVKKAEGKGLSTENYTTEEKQKLEGIEEGATNYKHPSTHSANIIIQNSERRFVSDSEKANWNDANSKKHTHSNKSILDKITQTLIDRWNNAVEHTSDMIKHITQAEREKWNTVETKVDKVSGKKLTTNDYTTADKNKLAGIQAGAQVNRGISSSVSSTSTSTAASSKAVKTAYDKANQAFQSASDGKTLIASAITGKGQSASGSDTFSQLAGKINNIIVGLSYSINNLLIDRLYSHSCEGGSDGENFIHEFNPDNFTVINMVKSPSDSPKGIGGTQSRLYCCDWDTNKNYELNPNTLVVIKTVNSPSDSPSGIGGIQFRLYCCDSNANKSYELNPNTLVVTNSAYSSISHPSGIGGMQFRLYYCDTYNRYKNYELNPDSLVVINSLKIGNGPSGIGGMQSRLYSCDTSSRKRYELNPNTLTAINEIKSIMKYAVGIGGIFPSTTTLQINTIPSTEINTIVYNSKIYK